MYLIIPKVLKQVLITKLRYYRIGYMIFCSLSTCNLDFYCIHLCLPNQHSMHCCLYNRLNLKRLWSYQIPHHDLRNIFERALKKLPHWPQDFLQLFSMKPGFLVHSPFCFQDWQCIWLSTQLLDARIFHRIRNKMKHNKIVLYNKKIKM